MDMHPDDWRDCKCIECRSKPARYLNSNLRCDDCEKEAEEFVKYLMSRDPHGPFENDDEEYRGRVGGDEPCCDR